jgi:hypothetical protein
VCATIGCQIKNQAYHFLLFAELLLLSIPCVRVDLVLLHEIPAGLVHSMHSLFLFKFLLLTRPSNKKESIDDHHLIRGMDAWGQYLDQFGTFRFETVHFEFIILIFGLVFGLDCNYLHSIQVAKLHVFRFARRRPCQLLLLLLLLAI